MRQGRPGNQRRQLAGAAASRCDRASGIAENLAFTYGKQGQPAYERKMREEILTLQRQVFVPDHRDTWLAMNNLAWVLATCVDPKVRDGQGALGHAELAVACTARTNATYLDTLAAAHAEVGHFEKAVAVQREAIALLKRQEAKRDYASRLRLYEAGLPCRNNDAQARQIEALLADGKFAEAEQVATECLAISEKLFPDQWGTFNARSLLGGSLLGQKKYAEAEPLLLSGYEGMERRITQNVFGPRNLREVLQQLVELYEVTARPIQAAEWKQKLAEFQKGEPEKPTVPAP